MSKHMFGFNFYCSDFLLKEFLQLSKEISDTFRDYLIKKNKHVFNLIEVKLMELLYELLTFRIYCHLLFCRRGSKTAARCQFCTRFFVDGNDICKKLDTNFSLCYFHLKQWNFDVGDLMHHVKAKKLTLSLNYVVAEYVSKNQQTENYGEIFLEFANNAFSIYIIYLQVCLRV